MESSTWNRLARVLMATLALALAATILASAAPSLSERALVLPAGHAW